MYHYNRAYINIGNDEFIWYDFQCPYGEALEYAKSKGLGDVEFVTTLPSCYMPYTGSYIPAYYCNGDCPRHTPEELAEALSQKVMACGCHHEVFDVGDSMLGDLGTITRDKRPWFRRVCKRIKDLIYRLIGNRDEAMAIEFLNHVSLAGHPLHWHVLESGHEVVGFAAVAADAQEKPCEI